MSHVIVTLIGTPDDLDWIYENCTTDSSSESSAEQAFGYDYLLEVGLRKLTQKEIDNNIEEDKNYQDEEWAWKEEDRNKEWYTSYRLKYPYEESDYVYKKSDNEANWILNGQFDSEEILDLRPRKDWYNVGWDYEKECHKSEEEIIEWFKSLPDNTSFFVCTAHL